MRVLGQVPGRAGLCTMGAQSARNGHVSIFIGLFRIPEMYELSGPPFKVDPKDGECLVDRRGEQIQLMGASRKILSELADDARWQDTQVGLHACAVSWVPCLLVRGPACVCPRLSHNHRKRTQSSAGCLCVPHRVPPMGQQLSQGRGRACVRSGGLAPLGKSQAVGCTRLRSFAPASPHM